SLPRRCGVSCCAKPAWSSCTARPTDPPERGRCAFPLRPAATTWRAVSSACGKVYDASAVPVKGSQGTEMSRTPLSLIHDASSKPGVDIAGLQNALAQTVTGEVRFDRLSRALYSTDASVYQIVPLGVVLPRDEADVAAVVRLCSRFGVPITARGGGTSQAGQAIGPGLVLDFSKYLNRIVE